MIDLGRARVRVFRHDGRWYGITFTEDKERVGEFITDLVDRGDDPARSWGSSRG